MSLRRTSFTQRRLLARFRWAALLMLLPLLALAGVSGVGLVAITNASGALDRAEQLSARVTLLNEHVQAVSLASSDVLVGRGTANLVAMTAAEKQVNADLAALSQAPRLTAEQVNALPSVDDAWGASLPYRDAARRLGSSTMVNPSAAAGLEDFLYADLTAVTDRLASMEAAGVPTLAALRQNRDAAIRASAIAVMIALVLGLAIAAWSSRQLAMSVVRPLAVSNGPPPAWPRVTSATGSAAVPAMRLPSLARPSTPWPASWRNNATRCARANDDSPLWSRMPATGILVIEADGRIAFATPAFGEYVGSDGVTASRLSELVHAEDAARMSAARTRASAGAEGSTLEVEARLHHRDGTWRHTWVKLTNRFGDAAVAGMVLNISDVSERHEYEQQLTFQALHDALTGLANRELFRQRLERSASMTEDGRVNSVLYLDFDDFKTINDTQGHQVGDQFLVAMAERLVAVVRPEDTVARLGGDEYAVLHGGTDSRAAVIATKRVLAALQQPLTPRWQGGRSAGQRRHRLSPGGQEAPRTPSWPTPTWPCTSPSARARPSTRCSRRRCEQICSTGCSWARISARQSPRAASRWRPANSRHGQRDHRRREALARWAQFHPGWVGPTPSSRSPRSSTSPTASMPLSCARRARRGGRGPTRARRRCAWP